MDDGVTGVVGSGAPDDAVEDSPVDAPVDSGVAESLDDVDGGACRPVLGTELIALGSSAPCPSVAPPMSTVSGRVGDVSEPDGEGVPVEGKRAGAFGLRDGAGVRMIASRRSSVAG